MVIKYTKARIEPPYDKTNEMAVCPAKTQLSLGICPVWSESWLSAWWKLGSLATHWAHSEASDQTGWMPRLNWVFAGCTIILLVCHEAAQILRAALCKKAFIVYILNNKRNFTCIFNVCFLWTKMTLCKFYFIFECRQVFKTLKLNITTKAWKLKSTDQCDSWRGQNLKMQLWGALSSPAVCSSD